MASSYMSPPNIKNEYGGVGTGIAYGAKVSPSNQVPLSHDQHNNPLGLDIVSNLAEKRFTRDGQPTKRRGPKPDSKPALTRRQELNRQAQRTHRERKEFYIKALEDEVLRLKEIYSNVSQDKERLAEENRSLKAILQQNGLSISGSTNMMNDNMSNPSIGPYIGSTSSASVNGSGSYGLVSTSTQNTSYTPPPGSAMSTTTAMQGTSPPDGISPNQHAAGPRQHSPTAFSKWPQRKPGIDYDQAGIDFVLALERPCMDHLPWLLERANASGEQEPCGHSLMASCPPEPVTGLKPDNLSGAERGNKTTQTSNDGHPQKACSIGTSPPIVSRNFSRNGAPANLANACMRGACPMPNLTSSANGVGNPAAPPRTRELSKADLATLLDLSQKLNLDGEITPVMAWGMVLGHPRLGELNERDFVKLTEELRSKVRCYGFGAVMEEFEIRDALEAILSTKPELLGTGTG